MAPRKRKKQEPKLTQAQRWKWRALEAEVRAELAEAKHLNLKLEHVLGAQPALLALYREVEKQRKRAHNAREAYRQFTADIAAKHGIPEERLMIDDETGCVKTKQDEEE